ncbi:MAG: hypothetical protein ABI728_11605 [Betaproteobacteria bacterium]
MRIGLVSIVLFLAACVGGATQPQWQSRSHAALARFSQQFLAGNSQQAQHSITEAKAAVAATGRLELAARVELVRCALATAALDIDACAGFDAIRNDAAADDQAYRAFLSGQWQAEDVAKLPSQYRALASARDASARNSAMQQIADPVSRLVAAGVLFGMAQLSAQGLDTAVETASEQGYRRALLAYLNVQAKRAEVAGDSTVLESIRKRIDLVYQSLPKTK